MQNIKSKIKKVNRLLVKKYGIPERPAIPADPVDMMIATILSQNTNDKNSFRAFNNLKESYRSWREVAGLDEEVIEDQIKVAGLGKQKAKAIKEFLNSLLNKKGKISLDYLRNKSDDDVLNELTEFNGVGVKTASCVLQFSFRRNICPVDTHVHRTTNRIGIVKTKSPDKTFFILKDNMPDEIAHSFHTNLIRLGREICKPAVPLCSICPLLKICEYEYKNLETVQVHKENKFLLLDSI